MFAWISIHTEFHNRIKSQWSDQLDKKKTKKNTDLFCFASECRLSDSKKTLFD